MQQAVHAAVLGPVRQTTRQRRAADPGPSTAGRSLTSSGVGLLTRGEDSGRWQRSQPQADTEHAGGGKGGGRPRSRLGYSGDGGQEEGGSDGLHLPWNALAG